MKKCTVPSLLRLLSLNVRNNHTHIQPQLQHHHLRKSVEDATILVTSVTCYHM